MIKFLIALVVVLVVIWLVSRPARRRRGETSVERQRAKAHNSKRIRYSGFDTSQTGHKGSRRVHAVERDGKHACSDQCPYCEKGARYQQDVLREFDDRLIRGRKSRRAMRRGE